MYDWTSLASESIADSEHWFPDVHSNGEVHRLAHFALGLVGEVGELDEVIFQPAHAGHQQEIANEIADVIVYCCETAACLDLDLDYALSGQGVSHFPLNAPPVLVVVGHLANAVKKLDRRTVYTTDEWDTCAEVVALALVRLMRRTLLIAKQNQIDVPAALDAKRSLCFERWGIPPWRAVEPGT